MIGETVKKMKAYIGYGLVCKQVEFLILNFYVKSLELTKIEM